MVKKLLTCLAVCTLLMTGLPLITAAAPVTAEGNGMVKATEPAGSNGTINWDKGSVEAVGVGIPSSLSRSPAQALLMARRTAITDARRNLLEAIGGIKVTAETTIQNLETSYDVVNTKISTMVIGAKIINEQQLTDGTYQVTLAVNLYGKGSLSEVITNATKPANPAPLPEPSFAYTPTQLPAYTGLIIDTTGLPLARSLSPAVYDDNGRQIYSSANLLPDYAISQGMIDYICTDEDLKSIELGQTRAGVKPVIVKAVALRDHNVNLVISQADADRILAANMQAGFLPKTMVCVQQNGKTQ